MIDDADRQRRAIAMLNELRDILDAMKNAPHWRNYMRDGGPVVFEADREQYDRARRTLDALRDLVWGAPR